jgi:hypothetical protein
VEFEGAMALDDFRRRTGVKMMKYDEGKEEEREKIVGKLVGNESANSRVLEEVAMLRYCGKYPRGFKGKERSQASLI